MSKCSKKTVLMETGENVNCYVEHIYPIHMYSPFAVFRDFNRDVGTNPLPDFGRYVNPIKRGGGTVC